MLTHNNTLIQNFISSLAKELKFNDEGPVSNCLGVETSKSEDEIELKQPCLIERAIEHAKLEDANPKVIPVVK